MESRADDLTHYTHPIFRPREFLIPTPAMHFVRESITRCIYTRQPGMVITGASRAGKTSVARSIELDPIKGRNGIPIPVLYSSIPSRDQTTIRMVLRNLCLAADLHITKGDTADTLSEMYFSYILDQSSYSGSDAALLIIDEFQRLSPFQLDAFAELYDRSERYHLDLTTVFIGSYPDCRGLLETLENPHYTHIYGRFFRQHIKFKGLRSEGDVRDCLQQYDILRYPAQGPTYAEYFLPDTMADGWALADMAKDLWSAFVAHTQGLGIQYWGMQYFISTVNTLLCDVLPRCGHRNYEPEHIHECLHISGILPDLVKKRGD